MPAHAHLPAQPAEAHLPAQRAESHLPAQPAKFFWFLPTNGDSRSIVGASHASSHHIVPRTIARPPADTWPRWLARPIGSATKAC
jgi:hypothetical protein